MKNIIKTFLSRVYFIIFGTCSEYNVVEIDQNEKDLTTMTVQSVNGFKILFHCKKKNYMIKNHHKWIPNYIFATYQVYGECNESCPEKLHKVLKKVVYFPKLSVIFLNEYKLRHFLIKSYIDLLNNELLKSS